MIITFSPLSSVLKSLTAKAILSLDSFNLIVLPRTRGKLGEYLFVVEASFVDKTQHIEKIIAKTMFKLPLCSLDLSSELSYTVSGIDYDADQVLWAKDMNGSYHKIGMHYDSMLIDYDKKVIYFREKYDTVDVGTP